MARTILTLDQTLSQQVNHKRGNTETDPVGAGGCVCFSVIRTHTCCCFLPTKTKHKSVMPFFFVCFDTKSVARYHLKRGNPYKNKPNRSRKSTQSYRVGGDTDGLKRTEREESIWSEFPQMLTASAFSSLS